MQKLVLLAFLIQFSAYSQGDTSYVYKHDMKYIGAEFRVDLHYRYVLEELVELAKSDSSVQIHVRGHVCCGPGKRLSRRRARKTYKYLLKQGISKNQLSYKGCSNEVPAQWPEEDEEDEIANRRVDFVITQRIPQ